MTDEQVAAATDEQIEFLKRSLCEGNYCDALIARIDAEKARADRLLDAYLAEKLRAENAEVIAEQRRDRIEAERERSELLQARADAAEERSMILFEAKNKIADKLRKRIAELEQRLRAVVQVAEGHLRGEGVDDGE